MNRFVLTKKAILFCLLSIGLGVVGAVGGTKTKDRGKSALAGVAPFVPRAFS